MAEYPNAIQREEFRPQPDKEFRPGQVAPPEPYEPEKAAFETKVPEAITIQVLKQARAMQIVADRTGEQFRWLSPRVLKQAPLTIAHTTTTPNEALSYAVNDAVVWLATALGGDEQAGSQIASYLIGDPVSRARTQAMLRAIAGYEYTPLPGRGAPGLGAGDPNEMLLESIRKLSTEGLSPAELGRMAPFAQALLENMQDLPSGDWAGEQIKQMIAVGLDGYSVILSEAEVATLRELVTEAQTISKGGFSAGTTTGNLGPDAAALGIDQIRRKGAGVLVLDEEWAKANPAEAFAIRDFLEAEFPGAEVQLGKQGIIGSLLNTLTMPVDYITAPVGAALAQVPEFADADNPGAVAQADEWMKQVSETGIAPADLRRFMAQVPGAGDPMDLGDVTRFLMHFRDDNSQDLGWEEFQTDMYRGASPASVGFGFAENFTKAAGMLPGDPNYAFTYAVTGLLAQIVADPLNWGLPMLGGLRRAGKLGIGGAQPKLHGYAADVDEIKASLLASEPTLSESQATLLARRRVAELAQPTLYPQVSRSWIEQKVFMNFARYPEQIATSKPFLKAQRQLAKIRAERSPEEFAALLVDAGKMPRAQAAELARATSAGDMGIAMSNDGMGIRQQAYTQQQLDELVARRTAAERALELNPADEAAKTDLLFTRSVLEGSDSIGPVNGYIGGRQLRRIVRAAKQEPDVWDKLFWGTGDFLRRFPSSAFGRSSRANLRGAQHITDEEAIGQTRRLFAQFGHITQRTGAGEVMVPPTASSRGKFAEAMGLPSERQLAKQIRSETPGLSAAQARAQARQMLSTRQATVRAATDASIQDYIAMMRFLGHSDDRIRSMIAPWVMGEYDDDPFAFYDFIRTSWHDAVMDSPHMTLIAKRELRDLIQTPLSERAGGRLVDGDPVLYKMLTEGPGPPVPSSMPSIGADLLQGVRLPDIETLREYMTVTGRTVKRWEKAGAPKSALSVAHHTIALGWRGFNELWRGLVLGTRLFFGLPARIVGEQMLRMAAFDYASAVRHPSDWLASVASWARKDSDYAAFWTSPDALLGSIVQDQLTRPNMKLAQAGRQVVDAKTTPVAYYRSYSNRVAMFFSSADVHTWRLPNGKVVTPQRMLDLMDANDEIGPIWRKHIANSALAPLQAAERLQQELLELIGTGEGAKYIRTAIRRGNVKIGSKTYYAGTEEFATKMQQLAEDGLWNPGVRELPRILGDEVPMSFFDGLRHMRDVMFRALYSAPDLVTSRRSLYRQVADREYKNLLRYGYSPQTAIDVARSTAAAKTADMLFDLGTKTSGEMFLRAIMPFFPAWRELGATWLIRAPSRIGRLGGTRLAPMGWALGGAELSLRAKRWVDFFKNLGVIQTGENGDYVALPFLAPMVRMLTGSDAQYPSIGAPLESLAGILPIPRNLFEKDEEGRYLPWNKRAQGFLPTIGGWSSFALDGLLRTNLPIFEMAEDWLTLYGADANFGPIAVDRLFMMFGKNPPFAWGSTRTAHRAAINFSVIDGMRVWASDHPKPEQGDRAIDDPEYLQESLEWIEDMVAGGEKYSQGIYLTKNIFGSMAPFSVQITDESKEQMSALWGLINTLPDGSPARSTFIDTFLDTYPELGTYMVGKTLDTRLNGHHEESLDEFMALVEEGKIKSWSPEDYAIFAYGSTSYSLLQDRIEAVRDTATGTYADQMLRLAQDEQIDQLWSEWEDFLEVSKRKEFWIEGQDQSFADMWNTYQQFRQARFEGKGSVQLSIEEERLLEFDRGMREYSKYFSTNPETADKYYDMRSAVFEKLGSISGPPSEFDKARDWWFGNVLDPYYTQLDKLWTKVKGEHLAPTLRSGIYEEIRQLKNHYSSTPIAQLARETVVDNPYAKRQDDVPEAFNPAWGDFPSPEEYSFAKLSPAEQYQERTDWANLPPEFLTSFQRNAVGYDAGNDKAIDRFIAFQVRATHDVRKALDDADISPTSNDGMAYIGRLERTLDDYAESLGIQKFRDLQKMNHVERVGTYLNFSAKSKYWDYVIDGIKKAHAWEAYYAQTPSGLDDFSLAGDDPRAEDWRLWLDETLTVLRNYDDDFNYIIQTLEAAVGGKDGPVSQPDLVAKWFFEASDFVPLYEFEGAA